LTLASHIFAITWYCASLAFSAIAMGFYPNVAAALITFCCFD
jgi:hypothetical protein